LIHGVDKVLGGPFCNDRVIDKYRVPLEKLMTKFANGYGIETFQSSFIMMLRMRNYHTPPVHDLILNELMEEEDFSEMMIKLFRSAEGLCFDCGGDHYTDKCPIYSFWLPGTAAP
jgi:hypothetical protein